MANAELEHTLHANTETGFAVYGVPDPVTLAKPLEIAVGGPDGEASENPVLIDTQDARILRQLTRDISHLDINDPASLYFSEAGYVKLLTQQEEIDLSIRIQAGRDASIEFARISKKTPDEFARLKRTIEDGWEAREYLILANTRLVISIAKKYLGRGVPFIDLVQEGNIGLVRASKKFEYRKGNKFSTYATWWVRQSITRAIMDQGRTIRVPVHMGDALNRMLKVRHRLVQSFQREPSIDELALAMDVPVRKVVLLKQIYTRRLQSLDAPVGDDEDGTELGDLVDNGDEPAEETMNQTLLRERLNAVLETIPPREAKVLILRFGLNGGTPYTLEEVGRKLKVTRERVRQIENMALRRMKQPLRAVAYDFFSKG